MGLAGHRPGQKRLARPRRSGEQHAVRHPPPETLVAPWIAQKVDDLGQLRLGLVNPGHIVEHHPDRRRIDPSGLRATERTQRSHATAAPRGPTREQHKQPDQQRSWPEAEQQ